MYDEKPKAHPPMIAASVLRVMWRQSMYAPQAASAGAAIANRL